MLGQDENRRVRVLNEAPEAPYYSGTGTGTGTRKQAIRFRPVKVRYLGLKLIPQKFQNKKTNTSKHEINTSKRYEKYFKTS